MRNFKIYITSIVIFFISISFGFAQPQNIFGGTPIDISQVPWQVSVERNAAGFEHWCGGTIINSE